MASYLKATDKDGNVRTFGAFGNDYTASEKAVVNPFAGFTDGAGYHNANYRGKYLGDSVTTEQYAAISAGTFTDLFIGDYWMIDNINWRIASFDYWLGAGDTACTTHHVVIIPDTSLYTAQMNSTATNASGYIGSEMYVTNLAVAKTTINSSFSGHILSHREFLIYATSNGRPSAGTWYDSTVDLPNECMLYGHIHFSALSDGTTTPHIFTNSKTQLAIFAHNPHMLNLGVKYWIRDTVSTTSFANVGDSGHTSYSWASDDHGVRPAFAITG